MGKQTEVGIRIRADGKGAVGTFRLTREELDKLGESAKDVDGKARQGGRGLAAMAKESVSMKGLALSAVSVVGAVGAASTALYAMVNDYVQTAKAADNYSKALGVSVESLTAWQYAANDAGIQADKIADIFKDTAEKIGDAYANGGGEAVEALDALGLSSAELVKLAPDKQLLAIAKQLDNVGTQAEKIQILESLASDASLLLPLLDNDAARLKQLTAEAQAFGMVLDGEAVAAARQFDDQMRQLKANASGLTRELVQDLLPGLNEITEAMVEAAKDGGPLLALWVGLRGAMSQLVFGTELQQAADDVKDLKSQLDDLVFRKTNYAEGEGGWLGDAIRGLTYGSPEELDAEIASAEAALQRAKQRLDSMQAEFLSPSADAGAGGSAGGSGSGGKITDLVDSLAAIKDPLGDYILQLEQEALLIGQSTEQRAVLQAQWKAEEMARKALASAEKAESEGKKALAQQYRDQAEKIKGAIPLITSLAAANEKETTSQKRSNTAKEEALKLQVALESAYTGEIQALADQQIKLTSTEREYYRYTLTLKGFEQAQIDAAMAIWDNNQALQSQAEAALAAADATAQAAEQMQREQENIANSLTDALMRGFEDGKDFAGNFVDTLKNMFQTLVLRPLIQPVAGTMASGITGMLMPGSASAGAVGGSGASSLSNLSTLGNLFGGFGSLGTMASYGTAAATGGLLAGATQGGMLAAQTGVFGASGAALTSQALGGAAAAGGGAMGTMAALAPLAILALPLLGGLFKKKPSDKAQWGSIDLSTGSTFDVAGQTGDKFSQENADARDTLLSGFSQFSTSLGAIIGEELEGEIRVHLGNRDGVRIGFDGVTHPDELTNYGRDTEALQQAGYDYIWEEFLEAADQFSESMLTLMEGITDPNDRLAGAQAFSTLQDALDADLVANYATAVEQANKSLWDVGRDQYNSVMDLVSAYDGSVEATQTLANATVARYQTEIALLAQIDAAITSTNNLFSSSRQQFDLAGLTDEETYNYYKSRADSGAADLANLIDPVEIERQLNEINRYYLASWGTLNEEQQAAMKDDYLSYIDDLEALRDDRLSLSRDTVTDQHAEIARDANIAIIDASARFVEAADKIAAAAARIDAAASEPVKTDVTVHIESQDQSGLSYDGQVAWDVGS